MKGGQELLDEDPPPPPPPCVVAIDFGTTYSGYAFQTRQQYENNKSKIFAPNWIGAGAMISLKTPTCILLDSNKEFLKFGYEAEDKYADLALDDEHGSHYFFRRFKMKLHRNPVSIHAFTAKD